MTTHKTISGWECEQAEHVNSAQRNGSPSVEMFVDGDSVDFYAEQGSEYARESVQFSVPTAVLVRMLVHAGLVVPVCTCAETGHRDRGDVERCRKHGGAWGRRDG